MVKQWRFFILISGFILLFTGWSSTTVSHHETLNVDPLVHAFQANNLPIDTWIIHHGAPLDQPLTERQLKHLTSHFRLTEQSPSFLYTPNSNRSERVFLSDQRNISMEIRVIRRGHEKHGSATDYLVVNVKATGQTGSELIRTTEDVSKQLQQVGVTPHIQVSIQGKLPNVLDQSEQQHWIQHIMNDLDARSVEAMRDATSMSVSAFSPHAGKPIVSNGQEMNVQIATRTDRVLQQTVITMGTPIITIEY